jgi:threonyl-tRNA synthetase
VTTTEREITTEVELAGHLERLNPAAVGWTRRPLHVPNLRIRRRVKAWEYWGIVTPRHILGVTVSNISYAGVLGIYLLDRQTGREAAHDAVVSPKSVRLPSRCGVGEAVGRARDFGIVVRHEESATTLEVTAPALMTELVIDYPQRGAGRDSLGVVVPWSNNLFQYTVKDVGRSVHGSIVLGTSVHRVEAGSAFAVLDHGRGRWPYRVTWNWAAGARPGLALNLGGKWTEGTGSTENGVIVEGRLHKNRGGPAVGVRPERLETAVAHPRRRCRRPLRALPRAGVPHEPRSRRQRDPPVLRSLQRMGRGGRRRALRRRGPDRLGGGGPQPLVAGSAAAVPLTEGAAGEGLGPGESVSGRARAVTTLDEVCRGIPPHPSSPEEEPSMSAQKTIHVAGDERSVAEATTAADLFGDDRAVVVARVDGELWDLDRPLPDGATVDPVRIDEPDGLMVLRHSCAHVLAQAVQQVNPDAKLGIGPPIRDGFYYDFDVAQPFTPEDLKSLEKVMQRIINEGQTFHRREISDADALEELKAEPYKCELVGLKSGMSHDDEDAGAGVEVGAGTLTIYDNLRKDGTRAWGDLCRGPHVPSTKLLGNAFKVMRSSAAYWRGNQANPQLQRVYGTAWPTKDDLTAYLFRLAEAEKRDHRKLGAELDLFSFPDELGSGLAVFHPKGGVLKREMEDYVRRRHIEEGFDYVGTPHISKDGLFHTSGHLPYYADTMFPPMVMEGAEYRLKAMNCPMHNLIYRSRGRSYRDLPMRLFEFGSVYRFEKSGVVHGLTRVRGMTQDDSHSYVTKEQAADEIKHLLGFVLGLLRDFGLNDFYLELSTRDEKNKDKFIGSEEQWAEATKVLEDACLESGLELVPDPGGAAFYGPKVSVQAKDAIGRTWQLSTIQYDFNQPEGFELEYQAADGTRQRPVMIHSAKFGSIERFIGVLTEHYAGAFPPWLAPVQVLGLPVAEDFEPYLRDVLDRMKRAGIRVELDASDDRFPKKIRNASKSKVPFILIAGAEDQAAGAVSFRYRDGSQKNGAPIEEAVEEVLAAVRDKRQV